MLKYLYLGLRKRKLFWQFFLSNIELYRNNLLFVNNINFKLPMIYSESWISLISRSYFYQLYGKGLSLKIISLLCAVWKDRVWWPWWQSYFSALTLTNRGFQNQGSIVEYIAQRYTNKQQCLGQHTDDIVKVFWNMEIGICQLF